MWCHILRSNLHAPSSCQIWHNPSPRLQRLKPIVSVFNTERLIVRKLEVEDAPHIYAAARESITEVYPFLPWYHPDYSMDETEQWLNHCIEQWPKQRLLAFAIFDRNNGAYIGGCGLNRYDEHPTANLGYWIRSQATGRGYATEVTEALIEFGFKHASMARIEIVVSRQNPGSLRVAEKSSAIFEGHLRSRILLHGKLHDASMFAAIRPSIKGLTD